MFSVRNAVISVKTAFVQLIGTAWHSCCQPLLLQHILWHRSSQLCRLEVDVLDKVLNVQKAACMLRVSAGGGAGAQTLIHGYTLGVTGMHAGYRSKTYTIMFRAACLQTYSVGKAQAR
jgi:hypothetical protein